MKKQMINRAAQSARDEMYDLYETLWTQFVEERKRRQDMEQQGNTLNANTEGT